MTNWQIPDALKSASIDVLKLALNQSDIRQKDLEITTNNITTRVQNFLTLLLGIVIASIGFCLSHLSDGVVILVLTIVTATYSFILSSILLKYAYTGHYIPYGGAPSSVLPDILFASPTTDTEKSIYISQLIGSDVRIKTNKKENERRWDVIIRVTQAAVFMPVVLVLIYLVALYWEKVYCFFVL